MATGVYSDLDRMVSHLIEGGVVVSAPDGDW